MRYNETVLKLESEERLILENMKQRLGHLQTVLSLAQVPDFDTHADTIRDAMALAEEMTLDMQEDVVRLLSAGSSVPA